MRFLKYLGSRIAFAFAALTCVDVIANTYHAAEPTSILAAGALIAMTELLVYVDMREIFQEYAPAQEITAEDVVLEQQKAKLRHLRSELRSDVED